MARNQRIVVLPAVLAVLLLCVAAPASAKLYRYTDKAGNVHIVDNPHKVPPEFQNQLAPGDRPDPSTGEIPDSAAGKGSSLPIYKSITPPAADEGASGGETPPPVNARENLRERNRDNCEQEIQRVKDKKKELDARYEAWASVERKKGVLSDSGPWIDCSSGDAKACIENHRKIVREREDALLKSSPFYSDYRTLEAKTKQLERRCRD